MPYTGSVFRFIETHLFTRLVTQHLSDGQHTELQLVLINNPELGAAITGTGGVRKLRWAAPGRGKPGGYRVTYYVRRPKGIIWMLTMYPKTVADSIPADVLREIREELGDE